MGQAQKLKDAEKKKKEIEELQKASQATAQKCMKEIEELLKKYNCALEVRHKEDVIMGERILRFGPVVIHHGK
jgi:DNA-binding protein H-NS